MSSKIKTTNILHPSSGSNNLVLASDGNVSITNTLSAGTIGSSVTITDGANPHGWEHIKTIAYSADTATPLKMENVVSSKYSTYKLIIQWGSLVQGANLFFRFLDTSNNPISTTQYHYTYFATYSDNSHVDITAGEGDADAVIGNSASQGSIGWNGEMIFYNCFAGQSDFPQIDGHQLTHNGRNNAYRPTALFRHTGYDHGDHYQSVIGSVNYNEEIYVKGFQLAFYNTAYRNVEKDSWWSCYGLKLPTAD